MPATRLRFIVNPRSGGVARALPLVRSFAARRGATVVLTERPRHAGDLAREAMTDGCEVIVAVGGDGTMNEVAAALVDAPATLGLVPCGSGDGLGRHLRIHGRISRALDILETGAVRTIDSGVANGHPFFTVAGIGFEAEIAHRFNRLHDRGFVRYLITSARAYREWRPERYAITTDGVREAVQAFTLAVANSDQYGNDARIAPAAKADDGLLDLTAVPPVGLFNALPLVCRLFGGSLPHASGILCRRGTHFIVEREQPGWLHTDGELHEAGRVIEFRVRTGSLRVMVPAGA